MDNYGYDRHDFIRRLRERIIRENNPFGSKPLESDTLGDEDSKNDGLRIIPINEFQVDLDILPSYIDRLHFVVEDGEAIETVHILGNG